MSLFTPVLKHGVRAMRAMSFRTKIGGFVVALMLPLWALMALQMSSQQSQVRALEQR